MMSQGQLREATAPIQAIIVAASTQHITTIHSIISLTNTARESNERTTPNTNLNRKRRKTHFLLKPVLSVHHNADTRK